MKASNFFKRLVFVIFFLCVAMPLFLLNVIIIPVMGVYCVAKWLFTGEDTFDLFGDAITLFAIVLEKFDYWLF